MPTTFETIFLIFFFALGACVGSFLNVVVYRMPLNLSIVAPGSYCPACKHPLAFYFNIPILAWFYLGGKCFYCKAPYSFRYPLIELLTALLFAGFYAAYFLFDVRDVMPPFTQGGWLILLGHLVLLSVLFSGSLIDLEHFIIPLALCYVVVIVALIIVPVAAEIVDVDQEHAWKIMPSATPDLAAVALGSTVGLLVANILLRTGLIKRSYHELETLYEQYEKSGTEPPEDIEAGVNHRKEMVREMAFLAPIALGAFAAHYLLADSSSLGKNWVGWVEWVGQTRWAAGLFGCLFGYLAGAATVWATRIGGSLLFGKEAMGLGDVHLMGAVGAMLGWQTSVLAFFIAPFFGLGFGLVRLIFRGQREIPYGPFLSLATVLLMIEHDSIFGLIQNLIHP